MYNPVAEPWFWYEPCIKYFIRIRSTELESGQCPAGIVEEFETIMAVV